jgi:glucosamine--fructose-6-phosphate aminotransferase (isomerizing)
MCGIVGYTGSQPAQAFLLDGMARLEYRGYDSCGLAVIDPEIRIYKDAIRVAALAKMGPRLMGTTGIGHTRWATHGAPCQKNAHPHLDCTGRIAVVHNGVIRNYRELTRRLTGEGHVFTSDTDTEVIAHLVEKYYRDDLEGAVRAALKEIEGSYAIVVLAAGQPGLVVARQDSPLIIGIGDGEYFIASDVPAVLDYTDRVTWDWSPRRD